MKRITSVFALTLAAAALACAGSSYKFSISKTIMVGDTKLAPGEYKIEMVGDKAVLKGSGTKLTVPAVLETSEYKFPVTSVTTSSSVLQEVSVGGTTTRIMISAPTSVASK